MKGLVFVEQRPLIGRIVPIGVDISIGREGCDVLLPDPEVSRRHAVLRTVGDDPAIEDLRSTNGTYVNDVRIQIVTVLREGDEVRLGNTVWRVERTGQATRVATTPDLSRG
jgi:pSer/pThr/pTyr-binding forkhead associated (FHA) protein